MRFLPALRRPADIEEQDRSQVEYSLDEWMEYLNELVYNGNTYFTQSPPQTQPGQRQEPIGPAYRTLTDLAYKTDSIVFSCMLTRVLHFSEVRFQFRQLNNGRPGKLFGNQDLQPLEVPWSGGTTGDLLTRMMMHADLGGNAFVVRRGDGLALLRPDWVTIIIGSNSDPELGAWATDSDILGYIYSPGGYAADGYETETYSADEVAHFAPIPDPEARFRGMSWLTPLIREVMADKAASEHKLKFFENPTPNMVVKMDVPNLDEFKAQVQAFKEAHMGPKNAYKYMFTASGVDATPVGSNMKDLDYKLITGAGETRIAAAARTPPVIVGLSEGLQGSALNSGNYQAARRMFADGCIRPMWRNVSASLANIITVPGGAELWYDDRDVAFLKEDLQERAAVMQTHAQAVRYLVDAGYKPDTVIDAIVAEDLSLLEHSGLFSVQLQAANAPKQGLFQGIPVPNTEPGAPPAAETAPATNGNGNGNGRSFADDYPQYRPETHVHFDEGAFNLTMPGQPEVNFHEGAFRNDIAVPDVRVEPAEVKFEEGAINVQPAEVTIEEGAIRNEITAPDVHVSPAEVRFEEGAIRVDAPPAADVSVNMDLEPVRQGLSELAAAKQPITVEAPNVTVEPANVEVTIPERSVEVNVPENAPVVNVTTPDVTVNVPDQPAPVVNVNIDEEPMDATVAFKRDSSGKIKSADITENETGEPSG